MVRIERSGGDAFSPTWTMQITSIVRGVDISISPIYQSGLPGHNLYYTVVVTNIGTVPIPENAGRI